MSQAKIRVAAAGVSACSIVTRRAVLSGLAATPLVLARRPTRAASGLSFGLTPVVLNSDIAFLDLLRGYLEGRLGVPVSLVQRRTYQEITALLLSGQLDAAWICGAPLVASEGRLDAIAVPVYKGVPLYQSYLIANAASRAVRLEDLRATSHAFSDPDSNSGCLVTRYRLARIGETPESFFAGTFFTYGHRNVIRAVAAGLAGSGSVDGYVWDVLAEVEPALVQRTRVVSRSAHHGFPPVACLTSRRHEPPLEALTTALLTMPGQAQGRALLRMLRLDGFTAAEPGLFDSIAAMHETVRGLG